MVVPLVVVMMVQMERVDRWAGWEWDERGGRWEGSTGGTGKLCSAAESSLAGSLRAAAAGMSRCDAHDHAGMQLLSAVCSQQCGHTEVGVGRGKVDRTVHNSAAARGQWAARSSGSLEGSGQSTTLS